MKSAVVFGVLVLLGLCSVTEGREPFSVSAELSKEQTGTVLAVSFSVQDNHYLYADRIEVKAAGDIELFPKSVPEAKQKYDQFLGKTVGVYNHDTTFTYTVHGYTKSPLTIEVRYQGCSKNMCFLPVFTNLVISLAPDRGIVSRPVAIAGPGAVVPPADWRRLTGHFTVAGRKSGYLNVEDFLAMLDRAQTGAAEDQDKMLARLQKHGLILTLFFIVVGGLALNLTPCVLPMIPINLAIIGAGVRAGSRRRGFTFGAAYGAGIAVVYGVLGLVVVLTGARFGSLNASPVFNVGVAVLFLLLALAMFGVFNIDFSHFMSGTGIGKPQKASYVAAFAAGSIAALLAGACVAPVVISVLLFSANLYRSGNAVGLLLPFLLGIGMALPWPFAGAGLSFLPKPGKWMDYVKYAFGVVIFVLASYYGYEAYELFRNRLPSIREGVIAIQKECCDEQGWRSSLPDALSIALREDRPVFIDFWASWCKSCLVMDKTTFRNAEVRHQLERYVKVKYRAEKLGEPATREILDHFGVIGLPTYVILRQQTADRRETP